MPRLNHYRQRVWIWQFACLKLQFSVFFIQSISSKNFVWTTILLFSICDVCVFSSLFMFNYFQFICQSKIKFLVFSNNIVLLSLTTVRANILKIAQHLYLFSICFHLFVPKRIHGFSINCIYNLNLRSFKKKGLEASLFVNEPLPVRRTSVWLANKALLLKFLLILCYRLPCCPSKAQLFEVLTLFVQSYLD